MKVPLRHGSVLASCFLAVGCTGLGAGDTGWWQNDPDDPRLDGVAFVPDRVMVYAYASYDGDILDEFMLEPGNAASTLPPVMMFVFADNRYFSTWNEDYACEWVGQITVEGVDTMNDPSLWLGYAISLQMLETDCYDMDPWVWGEPTPTTMMEQGFFGLGYGPSSAAMKDSLQDLIELSGDDWATNWAPYIFSMYVGLWDDATSQLAAHEVAFTMSYKMEDGALTSTLDEEPEPVPLSDGGQPPHGLLIGYSWFDLEPSALL